MEYKYKAFISYRRAGRDSIAAEVLQQMLEQYVIPGEKGPNKKLGLIFRDKTHIDGAPHLRSTIYDALDSSEYLIVICSKKIMDPEHTWVMDEISYFLERHPNSRDKILTILVEDKPEEAIPRPLWIEEKSSDGTTHAVLPYYMDVRGRNVTQMKKKLRDQFVKLCATLLSCDRDKLARREEKRRRKQAIGWMTGIATIAVIIIGILLWSNIRIDDKNRELEQVNQELERANQDLEQQINDRLLRESELLTQSSIQALSTGDQHSAIRDAIDALPNPDMSRPYYAPAEQALFTALDLFDPSSSNLILRDTVVELTSSIDTFCVNADGTRLTIAGQYGTLNCFDTATGEHIWTQAFSGRMQPCELYNSLIVNNGNTITSLSQDSGEILWNTVLNDWPNWIELSNDSSYAFCLVNDEGFSPPMLIQISLYDGSVMRTMPLIDEDIYTGSFHTDTYDISSDGHYFAGCIWEAGYSLENGTFSADDNQLIVFLTDTNTGETQILQKSKDYLIPCSLEFTDQDTTLTITQYTEGTFQYRAEKIRISDGKVLWQTNTPAEEFEYYYHYMKWLDWLHYEDYLLLGAQRVLYALDMTTGEIIDIEHLDSKLIGMERLDRDTFSIVLEDGTYTTGHISEEDLDLHTDMTYLYDPVPVMELGEVWDVLFINGGYLRGRNGEELRPTTISSENDLPCCVAIIPQRDDWKMTIRQTVPYYPVLEEKELYTYHASAYNVGYRLSTNICGSDTLVLIDNEHSWMSQYMFYDRTTLESQDCFMEDGFYVYSFLKDGSAVLSIDDNGILFIYDRFSQKITQLSPIDGKIQMSFDGHLIESTIIGYNYGQLARDHALATIVAAEHGLLMWLDDQKQPDIPFPAELSASYPEGLTSCELHINENGFVQLNVLGENWECICDTYYVYSIWENKWYSFPIGEHPSDCRTTCLGVSEPTFTVMDDTGAVRVYDMASGDETLHFNISIDPGMIQNVRWIMDDRYLAVRVGQDQVFILDGTTGKIVFSHTATMINHATDLEFVFMYEPQYVTDPSGKRLYIWDQEGICVDTESWTKLVDIPHMLMYDPVSDMVLTFESFGVDDSQPKHVTAIHLPTTEELVAIGKAYLGE